MASGEASERSKATGGYVTLGLQLVGWRTGQKIAREAPDAFPREVAASGRRRITGGFSGHRSFGLKRSRNVNGHVRSGDLTAMFGRE